MNRQEARNSLRTINIKLTTRENHRKKSFLPWGKQIYRQKDIYQLNYFAFADAQFPTIQK
jgi:hypothetical protein